MSKFNLPFRIALHMQSTSYEIRHVFTYNINQSQDIFKYLKGYQND